MACLFYFTDFTAPSLTALENILSLADTLRARILFVHFIPGKTDQPVLPEEETVLTIHLNAFRHCVMQYAYAQNCRMLTGHLYLRTGDTQSLQLAIKKYDPYAAVYIHGYAGIPFGNLKPVLFNNGTCMICSSPDLQLPSRIRPLYIGGLANLNEPVMDGLMHLIGLLRDKLDIIYPAEEFDMERSFKNKYIDAFRYDHLHVQPIKHFGLHILRRADTQVSLVLIHAAEIPALEAQEEVETWPAAYQVPFLIFPEKYSFRAVSLEGSE
ncbi:MAG: hypothetical protein R2794_03560 [Chitinophagales bacterium]